MTIRFVLTGNIFKTGKRAHHNKRLFQRIKSFFYVSVKRKFLTNYLSVAKTKFTELQHHSDIEVFKWLYCP